MLPRVSLTRCITLSDPTYGTLMRATHVLLMPTLRADDLTLPLHEANGGGGVIYSNFQCPVISHKVRYIYAQLCENDSQTEESHFKNQKPLVWKKNQRSNRPGAFIPHRRQKEI